MVIAAFETDEATAEEPDDGDSRTVEIPVVRYGGSLGVVGVRWQASLNGVCPYIYISSNKVYF